MPDLPWGRTAILMAVLMLAALGGWEVFWRSEGFRPSYRGSDGLWAMQRHLVDRGGRATVTVGSSRTLSDLNLEVWLGETGLRPIQLALEGTNPRPVIHDLAGDPDFTGLLVVGVTPVLFIAPDTGYRAAAIRRYGSESPSQWMGQRLSMPLERVLAFYNFDTALFTVLKRQTWWPVRSGVESGPRPVRKLFNYRITRQADLWLKLDDDPAYAALVQDIWRDFLYAEHEVPPPEVQREQFTQLMDDLRVDVEAIRGRGGEVVFFRAPSGGEFRDVERDAFPREKVWDAIVEGVDAVGVHFEDYPELQGMSLPEWSHMSSRDSPRYTRALVGIIRRQLAARGIERQEFTP